MKIHSTEGNLIVSYSVRDRDVVAGGIYFAFPGVKEMINFPTINNALFERLDKLSPGYEIRMVTKWLHPKEYAYNVISKENALNPHVPDTLMPAPKDIASYEEYSRRMITLLCERLKVDPESLGIPKSDLGSDPNGGENNFDRYKAPTPIDPSEIQEGTVVLFTEGRFFYKTQRGTMVKIMMALDGLNKGFTLYLATKVHYDNNTVNLVDVSDLLVAPVWKMAGTDSLQNKKYRNGVENKKVCALIVDIHVPYNWLPFLEIYFKHINEFIELIYTPFKWDAESIDRSAQ